MSRTKRVAIGLVALAAAGGVVAGALTLTGGSSSADVDRATVQLSSVTIAQQDLTSYTESSATLGFTEEVTVASPVAGTVTGLLSEGSAVTAGTVVGTIDGAPVVAMIGDVPGWRDLDADSDDGVDVRQLETNLVALGYDPDGDIEIDETYDDATEAAVEAWETALGVEDPDGEVPAGQIVFVSGDLVVGEVSVTLGASVSDGGSLFTGRVTKRTFAVPATVGDGGVVDRFAAPGTAVTTGTVLFWQGGTPVVALEGDIASMPALSRDLAVGEDDGSDVKAVEQFLVAGGFDPDAAIVVDDEFDDNTAIAVVRFWQSIGAVAAEALIDPADVVVPAGSFVTVPTGLLAGDPVVADGTELTSDSPAAVLTRPARLVMYDAEVGDGDFALGSTLDVVFPDDSVLPGTVTSVSDVATAGADGGDATIAVEISVDGDLPASVASLAEVPVTLRVVNESTPDAFVVPVAALVALAEGGYGLQVLDGTTDTGAPASHLIGVEVGQFTDGMVAVTGADVAAGLDVVVPS
jgi:peptidoglycan hydrolase-like protein with peptidoglycan-binding domain